VQNGPCSCGVEPIPTGGVIREQAGGAVRVEKVDSIHQLAEYRDGSNLGTG